MRHYETQVQALKDKVLTAVARLAWNDRLQTGDLTDIPEEVIPGPEAQMRSARNKVELNKHVKEAGGRTIAGAVTAAK